MTPVQLPGGGDPHNCMHQPDRGTGERKILGIVERLTEQARHPQQGKTGKPRARSTQNPPAQRADRIKHRHPQQPLHAMPHRENVRAEQMRHRRTRQVQRRLVIDNVCRQLRLGEFRDALPVENILPDRLTVIGLHRLIPGDPVVAVNHHPNQQGQNGEPPFGGQTPEKMRHPASRKPATARPGRQLQILRLPFRLRILSHRQG